MHKFYAKIYEYAVEYLPIHFEFPVSLCSNRYICKVSFVQFRIAATKKQFSSFFGTWISTNIITYINWLIDWLVFNANFRIE
jgi:hypothetical protein